MLLLSRMILAGFLIPITAGIIIPAQDVAPKKTAKEALKPLQTLIGSWRCSGQLLQGPAEQREKGNWTETFEWEWRFKGIDSWLMVKFKPGKYFRIGTLRYEVEKNLYQFEVQTADNRLLRFDGDLKGTNLVFNRIDEESKESQRLSIRLLHSNRITYRYEIKHPDRSVFVQVYQVGATKEGVDFAGGDGKRECVVSGGLGTIPVIHQGMTYYVCCTGCKSAFLDDPEHYLKQIKNK